MKKMSVFIFSIVFLLSSSALAKRVPPKEVDPIKSGEIEYRVPLDHMGCIEAWDAKRNELIYRRQIYVVIYVPSLERDVQDVHIETIELKDSTLIVLNERKSKFELDLESLEINVIKGSLVETWE